MEYTVHDESGVTVIDLSGEIDVSHAPRLRELLGELITAGPGQLLINLSGVAFIDSSGLGVLIAAHRKAQEAGGVLGLADPQPSVRRVLELTRTNRVFQIFATVEEGLAALRNT